MIHKIMTLTSVSKPSLRFQGYIDPLSFLQFLCLFYRCPLTGFFCVSLVYMCKFLLSPPNSTYFFVGAPFIFTAFLFVSPACRLTRRFDYGCPPVDGTG